MYIHKKRGNNHEDWSFMLTRQLKQLLAGLLVGLVAERVLRPAVQTARNAWTAYKRRKALQQTLLQLWQEREQRRKDEMLRSESPSVFQAGRVRPWIA